MQTDLFDGKAGQELAMEGMNQVAAHNPSWVEAMEPWFIKWVRSQEGTFCGEDWRKFVTGACLPQPKHPNCWGAVFNAYAKKGYCRFTGDFRQAQSKKSHAHYVRLWEKGPFFVGDNSANSCHVDRG